MANLTYPKNAVELKIFATQMVIDKSTALSSSRMAEIDKMVEHLYQSMGGDAFSNVDTALKDSLDSTKQFIEQIVPIFMAIGGNNSSMADVDLTDILSKYGEDGAMIGGLVAEPSVEEVPATKTKKK